MKILAFAGSNSSASINKKLVTFASKQFENQEVEILDLNDYEMPIYSFDRETQTGIPQLAFDFAEKIDSSDFLLISLAENNGNFSAAFKNLIDWVSRISGRKVFNAKPVFLMATSPGGRGGASVLEYAENRLPYDGAIVIDTFSLPLFSESFDNQKGIVNEIKLEEFNQKIEKIKKENF